MDYSAVFILLACCIYIGSCHDTAYCPVDPCPGGVAVRGSCYRLFNFRKSWWDAQDFCKTYESASFVGGRLGAVYTSTHQAALRAHLSTAGGLGQPFLHDAWLGGRLQDPVNFTGISQRMWRWVSDCTTCPLAEVMTDTAVNEQGCFSDWANDRDFTTSLALGGVVINVTCQNACADMGYRFAALAKPSASQDPDFCFCGDDFGRRGVSPTWGCSVECRDDPDQNCGGVNRNHVYNIEGTFANWASASTPPNPVMPISTFLQCGALNLVAEEPMVDSFDCIAQSRFVCGLPQSQCDFCPCGAGCHSVEGRNLCVYVPTAEFKSTWFNARQHCVDRGGDLLVLDSPELHKEVAELLREHEPALQGQATFIGLYKDNYYWDDVDGGGTSMTYSDFMPAKPSNDLNLECIYIEPDPSDLRYQWDTGMCSEEKSFICQFPLSAQAQARAKELKKGASSMSFVLP